MSSISLNLLKKAKKTNLEPKEKVFLKIEPIITNWFRNSKENNSNDINSVYFNFIPNELYPIINNFYFFIPVIFDQYCFFYFFFDSFQVILKLF